MSQNWMFGSTYFADVDLKRLWGSLGLGFYRLMAEIGITMHNRNPEEKVTVTNIGGELWVHGKDNKEHYLGYLRRQGVDLPLETYPHINTTSISLEAELSPQRISAIEEVRLGEDLSFRLDIFGIANGDREKDSQPVRATLQYRANQSTWIEILEQMGYKRTMLLEVPIAEDEVSPLFAEARNHLQMAQTHLLRGHYRDAVGACRDVMEALSIALNDERDQLPETIKSWFEDSRSMGKEERIRLMRRAFKVLTNAARHADEIATSIEWGPVDARVSIIIAAALLQMAAE